VSLVIAPASHSAASYAVTHWHYSRKMPAGKLVRFGVWESDEFVGAVIFGRGAVSDLGTRYGLIQTECAELVRVALRSHRNHVTRIIAESLRLLKRVNPGLRFDCLVR
jgi:hypothetical protein